MTPPADWFTRLREFLFPHEAEQDESFRREIRRLSRRSLYLMGLIILVMAVLVYPATLVVTTPNLSSFGAIGATVAVLLLGGLLVGLARSRLGESYGRHLALLMMLLLAATGIWFDLSSASDVGDAEKFVLADMLGVMLMSVVLIPALPVQVFLLGIATTTMFVLGWWLSPFWGAPGEEGLVLVASVLFSYALFCPILSAVNYHRLWSSHRSHTEVLRTQRNLLLTENAASMGRLAAALSHELNNPLGTIKSAISTLAELAGKRRSVTSNQTATLDGMESQLHRAAAEAVERMDGIIHRMQRFTNLDRAEVRSVQLGELLADIVALIDPERRFDVDIQVDASSVPAVVCRPQPLAAVLSRLVEGSIESVPKPGRVDIRAAAEGPSVVVEIRDNRPRIPPRHLATLFEPRFRTSEGRIATANWNWFTSRQIIRESGGELSVTSDEDATTTTIRIS